MISDGFLDTSPLNRRCDTDVVSLEYYLRDTMKKQTDETASGTGKSEHGA
jgi:hypothetical protein